MVVVQLSFKWIFSTQDETDTNKKQSLIVIKVKLKKGRGTAFLALDLSSIKLDMFS